MNFGNHLVPYPHGRVKIELSAEIKIHMLSNSVCQFESSGKKMPRWD